MGYTIQISGPVLESKDLQKDYLRAVATSTAISDAAAKTIASHWHSVNFSRFSHGQEFNTDDLLADVSLVLANITDKVVRREDVTELLALADWLKHRTGDYRS